MAGGITLAIAEAELTAALAAYNKALNAQSYNRGSMGATRADLGKLQTAVSFWDAKVKRLTRGGLRVRTVEVDE